jgi:glutaredoxin
MKYQTFELMEEERRDERSIFKQVESTSSPCIYSRDLDICLSSFRLWGSL